MNEISGVLVFIGEGREMMVRKYPMSRQVNLGQEGRQEGPLRGGASE